MNLRIRWLMQIILIAGILGNMAYAAEDIMKIPDVVATVNGINITRANLEERMSQSRAMNPERFDAMTPEQKKGAVIRTINDMALREVIYQEAARRDIVVTDDEVNMSLDDLKRRFSSEEAFVKAFAEAKMTIPVWKEDTRKNLMAMKLEGLMIEELKVSEGEIQDFYEKNKKDLNRDVVKISHILVETEKEAEEIIREFKEKGDFGALAKRYSVDNYTKDKGGDLGWYGRGGVLKEVEDAAYSLSPGEISAPVKSGFGYHIIRLEEKKIASEQTLNDHFDHVMSILKQQKWERLKPDWHKGLLMVTTVWRWSP